VVDNAFALLKVSFSYYYIKTLGKDNLVKNSLKERVYALTTLRMLSILIVTGLGYWRPILL
jgi:hypothetical protein